MSRLDEVAGRPVVEVSRRPYAYRTSYPLHEIEAVAADGSRISLLRKDLRRTGLEPNARRAKPEFLHDPRREIEAYRLLAPHHLGTAELLDSGEDWLLLEKIDGVELWQVDDLETWRWVARWLADLHELFADSPPDSPHLLCYDAHFYRLWALRARRFAGPVLDNIVSGYEAVTERLCALPTTLVHGEFYPSNVLVAGGRVAPVDWEMASLGPGLVDLAALTSGSWSATDRAAVVAAYGEVDPQTLDCCRLHLALQWLGWSRVWNPPVEHAHDWLTEALDTAERLGIAR